MHHFLWFKMCFASMMKMMMMLNENIILQKKSIIIIYILTCYSILNQKLIHLIIQFSLINQTNTFIKETDEDEKWMLES